MNPPIFDNLTPVIIKLILGIGQWTMARLISFSLWTNGKAEILQPVDQWAYGQLTQLDPALRGCFIKPPISYAFRFQ
ncbi:MAG: hypothetical protein FWF88_05645 [Peptococcaceae bacterium]|jgi:hypothetical protein|nr:hypothetical protein [Peptococcaceae bacterium]